MASKCSIETLARARRRRWIQLTSAGVDRLAPARSSSTTSPATARPSAKNVVDLARGSGDDAVVDGLRAVGPDAWNATFSGTSVLQEWHIEDWVVIANGTDFGEETAYSPDSIMIAP